MKKLLSVIAIILVMDNILTPFHYAFGDETDIFNLDENVVAESDFVESDFSDDDPEEQVGNEEDSSVEAEDEDENIKIEGEEDIQDFSVESQNEDENISEIQTGSTEDYSVNNQEEQGNSTGKYFDKIQNDEENESEVQTGNEEDLPVSEIEVQMGNEETSVEQLSNDEDNQGKTSGILDALSEEIKEIVDKIRYFFKKSVDSKYIKYGRDVNNIGTITLKDPKTSVSITIMDKNLGAESAGLGKSSYGYYFQWGNNHGFKELNSSNKTTKKAVYNDSYHSHGYDGNGLFIMGSPDYWEGNAHYNSLRGSESKEISRQAACPDGYHVPTIKEWNQLLSIRGKIHTQDQFMNENGENSVSRYTANVSTNNMHVFNDAATQCENGDAECVDEDKLSDVVEILSSELKLPIAGSYDENGSFHEGLGVYWTTTTKGENKAGVFSVDAYIGERQDETLLYRAQGHNIRCFMNTEKMPENNEDNTSDTQGEPQGEVQGQIQEDEEIFAGVNKEEIILEGEMGSEEDFSEEIVEIQEDGIIPEYTSYITGTKTYIVTWRNEDGTVRDITTVPHGQKPVHEDVTQPADDKYTYIFAGWEPEISEATGDAEYTAKYTYVLNQYNVTWEDINGTILKSEKVGYGSLPSYNGSIPTKQSTEYTYIFSGWTPEISAVKGNVTYRAIYTTGSRVYTIKRKNEDGTIRDTTQVLDGEMPTHEDVTQPADDKYTYIFAGWEPEISEATGDAEYTAKYTYVLNQYNVTWKNEDGSVLEVDNGVEYGIIPNYDATIPEKQSDDVYNYIFSGWYPEITEVTGNIVYIAKYDAIEIENEKNPLEISEGETDENEHDLDNESSLNIQDDEEHMESGQNSSTDTIEGENENVQNAEDKKNEGSQNNEEKDKGFFESIWETLKSFFLEDEDGYLRGSETIDNIIISVEAEEGTFPEGTEVIIKGVPQERLESIQTSLINDETNKVTENAQIMAFDISFVYNGEEIQPEKEVSVKFDYKNNTDLQGAKASELSIYHIDDDTDEGMEIDIVNKDGDEVEILATDFSIYVLALTPTDTFTLTLDAGEGSVVTGGNISVNGNGVGTISDVNGEVILPGATRQNYQFSGWYMTGGVYVGNSGDTYNVTDDITLYAEWQEEVMYTVTFDANRGTFVDGVIPNTPTPKSQSISDGTLITQAPTVEFPGYNLTGWWTEPRGGIQWDFANDIVTGNITLYAHWMYGEEYGDLDIYIWKNESTTGHYTFMDRNLGATELYDKVYCNKDDGNSCTTRRDYDSYGYYYQQGNNYGFDSYAENHGALSNGRTGSLNMSSYSWSNPYISSTFAGVGVENWTTNTNLWGGSQSDPSRKQGPCPDGYHVPNQSERTTIRNTWNAGNTRNIIGSIDKDFLMPAASYRQRANTEVLVSDLHHFRYLSSTYRYIFGDDNNANLTRIMKIYQEKISNGFSVRCIKDVKNEGSSAILTGIELNGGEKAIISVAEGKIQSLQEPTKTDYVFSGRYTTSDYQTGTKVVEGSPISAGTELYAKWDCPDGLVYNSNNQCVPGVLVRFMDGEAEYTRNVVLSGLEVTPPADPEKSGHIFTGWFESGANLPFVFTGTPITGNLDLYAHWDINKYNVNVSVVTGDEGYLSGMGSTGISLTGLYDYGAELVFIAIPESGYVFDYWMNEDQVLSGTDLGDGKNQLTVFANQDLDIIAFFKSEGDIPIPYTVEHYQQNLGLTGYDFVWSGIMYGTANEQTNATGTNYEGFTLSGNLSNYQTGIKADGSTVVRLYYNRDAYTITFENWNGDFLWSGKVASGTIPVYSGDDPSRPSTQQSTYTFTGWYPELSPITGDITYTAVYTESTRLYTVTLTGTPAGYGTLSPNSLSKEYETAIVISGSQLTIGGTEVILTGNEGYEFQEWTGNCGQTTKPVCDEFTVYSHPDPIEFTGKNNIVITSEGYDLFSQSGFQKDFEISFDILSLNLSNSPKQATLLSVKNEDLKDKWPGFSFRREGTNSNLELSIRGGSAGAVSKIYNGSSVYSVKISRESGKLYMAINGGNKEEVYDFAGFTNYFDKPITIGSIYQNGGYDRYIKATLSNILIKTIDTNSCYTGDVLAVTGDCQMTAVFSASGFCSYGGELYENGSVLTGYQSDSVACPNSCVSQVATCNNGEWSVNDFETEYSYSSCTYSGFSCDASEYPLSSCPENGICSSCTGYSVNDNACNQLSPIYKLENCNEHYHVNGSICEIDSHMVTIQPNNLEYGTVSQLSVTGDYESTITINGNTIIIGNTTVTATPTVSGAEYTYTFSGWTNTCGDTLTGNCTITANFERTVNEYTVLIKSSDINSGTVTTGSITVPYGINITESGNVVIIGSETSIANANTETWQYNFNFVDWTNTCGLTVTTGCEITANFESLLKTYTLNLVINTGIETIYYKINGADNYSSTGMTTIISGVEAGSEIIAYAQAQSGYTTETSESNPWSIIVTGNNIFSPEAIGDTSIMYIVYHYVKRVGTGTYALTETETGYGITDEILILSGLAKSNEFPCAHYDRGSLTGTESGPGEIVTGAIIRGDGSTKIYLYYNRNERTVTLSGDVNIESLEGDGVRECGSEVPVNAIPKEGYHFTRWDREERREDGEDETSGE